ncbi:MAG: alpha-xylosidase [Fimbriimonadaceae bacterium]|nr:alpha-xylosidase [Fimbriimonadaceae bacterium]
MKFTDGAWLVRPGVRMHYAAEVFEVEATPEALTLILPTRPIRHPGDTLQGPLLELRLSSPMPDVIRVRLRHFTGGADPKPSFEVVPDRTDHLRVEAQERLLVTAGGLRAELDREAARLDFATDEGRATGCGWRGMGLAEVEGEGNHLFAQLDLGVGENVYGLGERFTAFVKNGQVVDVWNKDGGTGSEQAYKNVPFYVTNRGYGVFVNEPGPVSFEVASEKVSRVQFSVPGESLEYYVIHGPTPLDVLEKYARLTGKPALPPAWSFGLWLTTSFTTKYDEASVTQTIQGMADRDLPLSVFHFDCLWMRPFHWCDFEWDPRTFPDPEGMLRRLKARGLRICVWINPYVAQRSRLFEEAKAGGYLLRKPDGDVWQTELWQPGMGIVDFTNPAACDWFQGHLRRLLGMGVDAFKTDFGERIPTDVVYHDGSDPVRAHNVYPTLYNRTVFELLEQERGKGDAVVFARSATAGGQKYPVHWGGDCSATFESMAESLRGGLSLMASGFGFWSHDIGGFEGTPRADVYKRWIAFGLFSSHSRLHGNASYRVPWLFDEESVDVLRFFTKWKCRLMPYLFHAAIQASERGLPMMRPMFAAFPGDPGCDSVDRQYMLGDSLLVAPVFDESGDVEYYVPRGRWARLFEGSVVEGPGWRRERHGFLSLPVLLRPASMVVLGLTDDRPDYDYAHRPTLLLSPPSDGLTVCADVPDLLGRIVGRATALRRGDRLTVETEGLVEPSLVVLDAPKTRLVSGANEAGTDAQGRRFRFDGSRAEFSLG